MSCSNSTKLQKATEENKQIWISYTTISYKNCLNFTKVSFFRRLSFKSNTMNLPSKDYGKHKTNDISMFLVLLIISSMGGPTTKNVAWRGRLDVEPLVTVLSFGRKESAKSTRMMLLWGWSIWRGWGGARHWRFVPWILRVYRWFQDAWFHVWRA